MNRKDFFKKLGLGAFTILVAPKVLEQENKVDTSKYIMGCDPVSTEGDKKVAFIVDTRKYPLTYKDCYRIPEGDGMLRVKFNGFYCIGDVFKSFDREWVVWYHDGNYYYCIPR